MAMPHKALVICGVDMISAERHRQIELERFSAGHDDGHVLGQLALAACCYATPFPLYIRPLAPASEGIRFVDPWPWEKEWDKRKKHSRLKQLAIAGALIAAEIDRLRRSGAKE